MKKKRVIPVLLLKDVDVLLEGTNLEAETTVAISKACIRELYVVILLAHEVDLIFARADFSL